jgi:PAS domain S-box-containing protein
MHEFASDQAAIKRSELLLAQHRSCSHILVCDGDREVTATVRPGAGGPRDPLVATSAPDLPDPVRAALTDKAVQASGAAVIATTPQGAVLYWNEAAVRLYGWKAEEALGRNVVNVTPALQSREQAAEIMKQLQRGEPWEGDIVLRRRDGTPFKAFVTDVLVGDGDNSVIVGASVVAAKRRSLDAVKPILTGLLANRAED